MNSKIEVSSVILAQALSRIESCAVSIGGPLPILGNVLMELREGVLWLTTTDLEVRATVSIQVLSGSAFPALTVNLAALSRLLVGCREDDCVYLRPVDDSLVVLVPARGIAAKLPTMPAVEFPAPLLIESNPTAHFSASTLREVCYKIAPFAASDETKPIITVVRVQIADWHARFEAADGFKLAIVEVSCEAGEDYELLIPAKVFSSIEHFRGPASLAIGAASKNGEGQAIAFTFEDGATLSAVCVNGKYPDLDKVVPHVLSARFKVNAYDWLCGLKGVTLPGMVNSDGFYHEVSDGGLDVVAGRGERAALCHIPIEVVEVGEGDLPARFVLGKGHIETVLQAAGGEVEIALQVPAQHELVTTPLLFTQSGWQAVLMPMVPNTRDIPEEELKFLSAELQGKDNGI